MSDPTRLHNMPVDWTPEDDKLRALLEGLSGAMGGICVTYPEAGVSVVEAAHAYYDAFLTLRNAMTGSDEQRQQAAERAESKVKVAWEHRRRREKAAHPETTCADPDHEFNWTLTP